MAYDKELVAGKLRRWEKYLDNYRLPEWKDIPDFGLYMEQVTAILRQYLDYLPPELKDNQVITAATINNYVRKKIMPEPVKKKYYRLHIAYLLIICSLKQSLSIPKIQVILPPDLNESQLKTVYSAYKERQHYAAEFFIKVMRAEAGVILDHDDLPEDVPEYTDELIIDVAIMGGFARLLAEKLITLNDHTIQDCDINPKEND